MNIEMEIKIIVHRNI